MSAPSGKSKHDAVAHKSAGSRANGGGKSFKYPSFKIHQSVTRFCLPLSKFNKLPSNKGKKLVVGALISVPSYCVSSARSHPTFTKETHPSSSSSSSSMTSISSATPKTTTTATESGRRILLVQRAASEIEECYPNHWEIPGGEAELGVDQTLLETVVREVKEETGLVVSGILGEFEGFEWSGEGDMEGSGYKQYNFVVEVNLNRDSEPGSSSSSIAEAGVKGGQGHDYEHGHGPQVRVTLNDEEHQAYRWISDGSELEGLTMTVNQTRVVKDGLKFIKKRFG
ncbi:hypothetical protein IAT40_005912 [Kwoniella sp. CBS 6097]